MNINIMKRGNANSIDMQKRIRELFAACEQRNVEKILSMFTDDIAIENVALGIVAHGKEQAATEIEVLFAAFPDLELSINCYFCCGDQECVEYVISGTHSAEYMGMPATGNRVSIRGSAIAELRDGKNCRISHYQDSASILRQMRKLS